MKNKSVKKSLEKSKNVLEENIKKEKSKNVMSKNLLGEKNVQSAQQSTQKKNGDL